MRDDYLMVSKSECKSLVPGRVDDIQFLLLVEISSIHSEKVIRALKDHLVDGYSRKEACDRHNVSVSYFSGALKRLKKVNQAVSWLVPYYTKEQQNFVSVVNG
ncbi:major pilu subunit operon regulatory protein PapB [Escherichia coli]|uniref:adhesin biosynthesis transcription regulatory family protein n=1 Tax=Escherichia coli TaxID=562 RepID=UPI001919D302|nr:adhesin biosynthesis transcription regulatory family protein [Escherichia coli]CAD6177056.1 major pilu subunit operon regulatory protein PapB [Escherichia coli]